MSKTRIGAIALALTLSLAACGGTPDTFLSVSGSRAADTRPPTVVGTLPGRDAFNVSTSSLVTVTFSEAVDPASVSGATFSLSTATPGIFQVTGASATFLPSTPLPAGTTITVTVSGVRDVAGNAMATPYAWSFVTAGVQG